MALDLLASLLRPVRQLRALRGLTGKLAPSPPTRNLIAGHLPEMRADRLRYVLDAVRTHGDIVRLRFGWVTGHLVAHPDHVRHVLVDNQKNYDKETPGFDQLRIILGNGLLTSEGAFWKRQRRIAQPAFTKDRVSAFAPTMVRATEEQIDRWLAAPPGTAIDIGAEMMRLALRIAGLTLLSTELSDDAGSVGESLTLLLKDINDRIHAPLLGSLPSARKVRFKRALARLDEIVGKTISARRALGEGGLHDLLGLLMAARDDETGEMMSDQQLRDEVMTMFLAGHETTANALTWSLMLASNHPAAAEELAAEVTRVIGEREITAHDVAELPYAKRFVSEALRLYPPAWIFGRRARESDFIGGYAIPRDSMVFVSPWITQRHPAFFTNPEGFDPDRFLPERYASVPKFAYFPFGAGPRICIGQGFAIMEAVLLLATIVRRVRLDLIPGQTIIPEPTITLRPKRAIQMSVHPRSR